MGNNCELLAICMYGIAGFTPAESYEAMSAIVLGVDVGKCSRHVSALLADD